MNSNILSHTRNVCDVESLRIVMGESKTPIEERKDNQGQRDDNLG